MKYDLERRTYSFAKDTRQFYYSIDRTTRLLAIDDLRQLLRASGSVGANYIEANESLSKKDFVYRIKICRKEAKESVYWLRLLCLVKGLDTKTLKGLLLEAEELLKIFGAITSKLESQV